MAGDTRVFFSHTVAAMFVEAFPPDQVPGLADRYRALGLDVSKPLLPAYEYEVWRACLKAQRELALGGRSPDDAATEQGARYVKAYLERTMLGGAILVVLRLIGARRALQRMTHNFRSANNFSQVTMKLLGPNEAELHVNDVFSDSPEYICGMLRKGLELAGHPIQITAREHAGDAATFHVTWA